MIKHCILHFNNFGLYFSTGWSKKRQDNGTDDGTPGGRYATGHCPVVVYVRRTHDGTLARDIVQATGQTLRHVSLPVVMWFIITFLIY